MIQTQPLPDPDDHPAADVVIYDGQCNFCKRQVLNLSRLDCCGHRLAFISLHDPRVSERYPALTFEELMKQMYVVPSAAQRMAGQPMEALTQCGTCHGVCHCCGPSRRCSTCLGPHACGNGAIIRSPNAATRSRVSRPSAITTAARFTFANHRLLRYRQEAISVAHLYGDHWLLN